MPRFNVSTGELALERRDWFDATRTVYQDCSQSTDGHCRVILSDGTEIAPKADTPIVAGGGGVAAWENSITMGVHDSRGAFWPDAATTLGCSPDGAYALKLLRNSYGPWDVIERDGSRWRLTDGDAHDVQLLGDRQAIWMIGWDHFATAGLPVTLPTERTYGFRGAWVPEEGRVITGYQRESDGAFVIDGHQVLPPSAHYFYADLEYRDQRVRLAVSPNQADTDPQVWSWTLAEIHALPVSPGPPPVEPPIEPPIEPPVEPPIEPPIEPIDPPDPPDPGPGPTPIPPMEDAMIAAYGSKVVPGFLPGLEIDNGNGTISILKPNGKYLCVTPTGAVEERDTPGGVWESFRKGKNCVIAERDGEAKGPQVFVLMVADV